MTEDLFFLCICRVTTLFASLCRVVVTHLFPIAGVPGGGGRPPPLAVVGRSNVGLARDVGSSNVSLSLASPPHIALPAVSGMLLCGAPRPIYFPGPTTLSWPPAHGCNITSFPSSSGATRASLAVCTWGWRAGVVPPTLPQAHCSGSMPTGERPRSARPEHATAREMSGPLQGWHLSEYAAFAAQIHDAEAGICVSASTRRCRRDFFFC